jgi:arginine-tRNA-protein transferase
MRYKGEYSPSYLADPVSDNVFESRKTGQSIPSFLQIQEEFIWFPLPDCIPQLERFRYATFVHPEHSLEDSEDPGGGTIM